MDGNISQTIDYDFGVSDDSNDTIVAVSCRFTLSKNKKAFLTIEVVCIFEVESESFSKKLKRDAKIVLPRDFACHLAAIATSTTRGVLYANTKGTPFADYLIELINIENVVHEDVEFITT